MIETFAVWGLGILALAGVVTSLLPFVQLPHGIFRVFEFPRTQNAIIAILCGIAAAIILPQSLPLSLILLGCAITLAIQLVHIARFTPVWERRSHTFQGDPSSTPTLKLLVSNVKQSNREYQKSLDLLGETDPDIALYLEVDQDWIDALEPALEHLPHRIAYPQDNGYGILFVSRFKLEETELRFLLNDEVPSVDTLVDHPDGGIFRLFAVHPEPPLANTDTIGRDAELACVAELVREEKRPVIVTGDMNDVAWSRTTRRFLRLSRLLDPREGRGQFNSFDARFWFLRWPLDHIFHSPHFQLISFDRGPFVGSDHFPMLFELALTDTDTARRETDEADAEDKQEARELVETEKQRDRRPAGTDWEDE